MWTLSRKANDLSKEYGKSTTIRENTESTRCAIFYEKPEINPECDVCRMDDNNMDSM